MQLIKQGRYQSAHQIENVIDWSTQSTFKELIQLHTIFKNRIFIRMRIVKFMVEFGEGHKL